MDVILTLFGIAFIVFVVVAELRERRQREWMALVQVVVPPEMRAKILAELAPLSRAMRVAVLRSILERWIETQKTCGAERDKVNKDPYQLLFGNGTVTADEVPNARGEFGLVPSNPIPCSSVGESHFYTAGLRALDGTKVICRRTGTVTSDVSPHLIDAYEVSHANGQKLATIYISPYQKAMSCKTPRGFRLG